MRLSYDIPCRLARLTWTVLFTLAWSGFVDVARADDCRCGAIDPVTESQPADSTQRLAQRLNRVFETIDQIQRGQPRKRFDPAGVVLKVGKDPKSLLRWVCDNTYWVAYRGALRGPAGVLMDRVGNSLDRALLLCALLRAAGHDARLAHSSLDAGQAKALLARVRAVPGDRLPRDTAQDRDSQETAIRQLAQAAGVDPAKLRAAHDRDARLAAAFEQDVRQRVARQTPALKALADVKDAEPSSDAEVISAMQDHWWAQWQDGTAWVDLDPSLPSAKPGDTVTRATQTIAPEGKDGTFKMDKSLWHEVDIRVVIETWRDGGLRESPVLEHTWRTAESPGAHFRLTHVPSDWPEDFGQGDEPFYTQYEAALARPTAWIPVLIADGDPITQKGFNDAGDVNGAPGAPILGGGGGAVGGGVGGILGSHRIGGPKEPSQLTAEWIEYLIRTPGKAPRAIRREVFDLVGPAARAARPGRVDPPSATAKMNRALALLGETEVLITGCQPSPQFIQDQFAQTLLSNRTALLEALSQPAPASQGDRMALMRSLIALKRPPERVWSLALVRSRWSALKGEVYLESPNIFSYHRRVVRNAAGKFAYRFGYDIVENHVAVRRAPGLSPLAARMEQGIVDTNCEAILLAQRARVENTSELFQSALGAGKIQWAAFTQPGQLGSGVDAPADVQALIRQELGDGHVVVAPTHGIAIGGREVIAWWRVDPRTGDTLGIGPEGYGSSAAEHGGVHVLSKANVFAAGSALGLVMLARCAARVPAPQPGVPPDPRIGQANRSCLIGFAVHTLADLVFGLVAEGAGALFGHGIGQGADVVGAAGAAGVGTVAEDATAPEESKPGQGEAPPAAQGTSAATGNDHAAGTGAGPSSSAPAGSASGGSSGTGPTPNRGGNGNPIDRASFRSERSDNDAPWSGSTLPR